MRKTSRSGSAGSARRSSCPIACSLDLLGDRWTLVVIRDLFSGPKTYGELLTAPEGIPTNILADRLKRLEQAGIIDRAPYQQNPPRYAYSLTARGADLKPVLRALGGWAMRHLPGVRPDADLAEILRG